jgi:nucleoside transporter
MNGTSIRNRLFIMMVLQIAIWGAWQIKIFAYMTMLGFTAGQQAWVGSVWGIAALLGLFFSNQFADRNFAAERFLAFSHVVSGLALIGIAFVDQFWPFFGLFMLSSLLYVPTLSVTNSLAFANLRDPAKDFGFVRMGGTVGWIIVSWPFIFLLSGKAGPEETRWVFIVAGLISFALAAYSLTLPHTPPRPATGAAGDRLAWLKAARLLGVPYVLVLFVVTFIDATIHNGYFVLWDEFATHVGISSNLSMVVASIGQVAEIVTMLALGTVLTRLGWKWTMIVGILGHFARFGVFALLGSPEHQWLIVTVQVLHGICYAFFFATVYIFVDAVFPKDVRSSAQGLFNLLILGVGMVVASQVFPRLKAHYTVDGQVDYRSVFLIPSAMAAVGMLLLAVFFHPPTKRPVRGQVTDPEEGVPNPPPAPGPAADPSAAPVAPTA